MVLGKCSPCSASAKDHVLEIWRRIRVEFTIEVRAPKPNRRCANAAS
jgi:hypothetical protein